MRCARRVFGSRQPKSPSSEEIVVVKYVQTSRLASDYLAEAREETFFFILRSKVSLSRSC